MSPSAWYLAVIGVSVYSLLTDRLSLTDTDADSQNDILHLLYWCPHFLIFRSVLLIQSSLKFAYCKKTLKVGNPGTCLSLGTS